MNFQASFHIWFGKLWVGTLDLEIFLNFSLIIFHEEEGYLPPHQKKVNGRRFRFGFANYGLVKFGLAL